MIAMGKTGSWRVFKPIFSKDKCVKCLRCWIFCPEGAIKKNKDGSVDIDMTYCKGCGICGASCPQKAISLRHFRDIEIAAQIEAFGSGG